MGDWLASLFGGSPGPTDREASSSEPQVTSQYPVAHASPQPHKSPATAALSASADISDSYYHEPSAEMNQDARQLQSGGMSWPLPTAAILTVPEQSPLAYQRTTAMSQPAAAATTAVISFPAAPATSSDVAAAACSRCAATASSLHDLLGQRACRYRRCGTAAPEGIQCGRGDDG